jgi:hypothetical protein
MSKALYVVVRDLVCGFSLVHRPSRLPLELSFESLKAVCVVLQAELHVWNAEHFCGILPVFEILNGLFEYFEN